MTKPISIYFHVPFCISRCGYCNFYSTTRLELAQRYTAALCHALQTAPCRGREAVTVYFGGGTPSLLGDGLLEVLEALRACVKLLPDAEVTLEANPGALEPGLLARLRAGGFNRISFGLQAADDGALALLGRRHTAHEGRMAVEAARSAGFENVSADILLATPGQAEADARALARYAADLKVEHISAYILKVEPETAFGRQQMQTHCPDPDATADIYLAACDELARAGYRHYEISNFARPGYESRHNSVYWQLGDYLGVGPSAHSLLGGRRFFFPPDLDGFLQGGDSWGTTVDDGEGGTAAEYVMLGLRLADGIDPEALRIRYGLDPSHLLLHGRQLAAQGLALLEHGRLALTEQGFLVSNAAIGYLLNDIC